MMLERLNFVDFFTKCLIQGLKEFGETPAQVIIFNLKNRYGMDMEDVANQPETFHLALMDIFPSGWKIIERKIIRILYQEMGLEPRSYKEASFEEVVEEAYRRFKQVWRKRFHRQPKMVGISGSEHRFNAILKHRGKIVAVDRDLEDSSLGLISLYVKMKDCNIKEGILLTNSQPDDNIRKAASRYNIHIISQDIERDEG